MKFVTVIFLMILAFGTIIPAEETQIQDFSFMFSDLFNDDSDQVLPDKQIAYKQFTILIFQNDNGFRFETYRILKINNQNIRSDKAVEYFGQGFQQFVWDTTSDCVGINDYFLLAGHTYRGWGQWSCARFGQLPPWTTFKRGQIFYVSYEYGREWARGQHWSTRNGAEQAAKKFVNYVTGKR